MIRETLTILSLSGLLVSVGLWAAGCFHFYVSCDWFRLGISPGIVVYQPYDVHTPGFVQTQWGTAGFAGIDRICSLDWPGLPWRGDHGELYIDLGLPILVLSSLLAISYLPFYRRRKRKKLGLCVRCGYDLRASKDRCPECGESFPK